MQQYLPITKRLLADIIDIIITILHSLFFTIVCHSLFGHSAFESGTYIGALGMTRSDVFNNPFFDQHIYCIAEFWTISTFVLSHAFTQFYGELFMASTIGIRLMGGVCVDKNGRKIQVKNALHKCIARLVYLTSFFIFLTHYVTEITPLVSIAVFFFISFVMLLTSKVNMVEKLTATKTIKRSTIIIKDIKKQDQ